MKKLRGALEIARARSQCLLFSLLDFRFFKNSETGNVLFFGSPRWLASGAVIFYVLANEVFLFRSVRLFEARAMLDFAYRLPRRLNKKWVDLGVLKANTNAQKLYARYGFTVRAQGKWSLVLRKSVAPG